MGLSFSCLLVGTRSEAESRADARCPAGKKVGFSRESGVIGSVVKHPKHLIGNAFE